MALPLIAALGLAAEFAPSLVRWLGGDKAGDVADKVVDVARRVTGKADPDEAAAALRADPALVLQFRGEALRLDHELERAYLQDRKDARARDVEYVKAGRYNYRADIMLVVVTVATCVIVWMLMEFRIDANTAIGGALIALLGTFAKCISDAFSFEFGSSRGSQEKTELLAKAGK